jgi:hypothetical protein
VAFLVLAVLAAIAYGYYHHHVSSKLREAIEALDREEPGWQLEDIEAARAVVPEEDNSALCVLASYALLPADWRNRELSPHLDKVRPNERVPAPLFAALLDDLEQVQPAVNQARKIGRRPKGRYRIAYPRETLHLLLNDQVVRFGGKGRAGEPNLVNTLLNDQERSRVIVRLLVHDAMRHSQLGQMEEAMRSCRAAVNTARSLGDEPMLISQLLRMACMVLAGRATENTLAQGQPPAGELRALQRLLEDEDKHPALFILMRGERALQHALFETLEKGDMPVSQFLDTTNLGERVDHLIPNFVLRDLVRAEHPLMLALMTKRIEAARLPLHEQAQRERSLADEVKALPMTAMVTRECQRGLDKMGPVCRRHQAYVRCLIVALAIERYRQEHDEWPKAVTDLVPGFLAAVPLDPFDGKPLRYRARADGVVVYSVGPDETDNGGVFDRKSPIKPGTDLGYQLWNVNLRGAPPRRN